jgi:nitrogen regulatory protein P-II 1
MVRQVRCAGAHFSGNVCALLESCRGPREVPRKTKSWCYWRLPRAGLQLISRTSRTILMTKVEAIIQPSKLDAVKDVLMEIGVEGMTISDVRGHGRQKGHTEHYRGREYTVDLLPKIKLELVLPDERVESVVSAILRVSSTGKIGDGKIFLSKVDEAIRIRNQERGSAAL